jgi:tRNA pseudouridine38-40 synthase
VTLFDEASSGPVTATTRTAGSVRLRLTVAYDGTNFHGFAVQAGGVRTVAGELIGVLERVLRLPEPPVLTCAGRTDAGVHAWGQVVHVDLPVAVGSTAKASLDEAGLVDLQRRLVKLLGPEVVVRSISAAPAGWDARHSALARHYRYTVLNRPLPDPFLHGRVWHVAPPLDVRAMQLACDPLIGEHDFSSFCRKAPPGADGEDGSLVRRVLDAGWCDEGDGILRFDITATSFCQQMVRSITGTLVDIGLGKRKAGEVAAILLAADRAAAGAVAPAEGLCLWDVRYDGYPNGG